MLVDQPLQWEKKPIYDGWPTSKLEKNPIDGSDGKFEKIWNKEVLVSVSICSNLLPICFIDATLLFLIGVKISADGSLICHLLMLRLHCPPLRIEEFKREY